MQSLKWKRPKRIKWIVFFLCLTPFFNLWHYANQYQLGLGEWKDLFVNLPNLAIPFLIAPFVLAYGIHNAKSWAYFSFLGFAALLISYNIFVSFKVQSMRNYSATMQSIFLLIGASILLNEEISAPYRNPGVRGWRLKKRKKIEIPVSIGGVQTKTKDISRIGAFVEFDPSVFKLGDLLSIEIELESEKLSIQAEILRLADSGIGLSFINLSREGSQKLKKFIKLQEA